MTRVRHVGWDRNRWSLITMTPATHRSNTMYLHAFFSIPRCGNREETGSKQVIERNTRSIISVSDENNKKGIRDVVSNYCFFEANPFNPHAKALGRRQLEPTPRAQGHLFGSKRPASARAQDPPHKVTPWESQGHPCHPFRPRPQSEANPDPKGPTLRTYAKPKAHVKPKGPRRRSCPFRKRSKPFSRHLENVSTINKIFLYLIKEKETYALNYPVSNPEPLFPNILLIPLHYQVHPANSRKI